MSGFEIAGLALGAFPLVLEGAKELDGLAKKFGFYWEFRTKFESFIADVNVQRIFYDQNIALLLESLDISDAERRKLQSGIEPALWDEEHIETEIRRKVKSDHYHWLICRIRDIAALLKGLRELFTVDQARLLDSNNIESVIYRLATSFSAKKDELLASLKKHNDDIHRYLDKASKINPPTEPPSRSSFRDQAQWKKYQKLQTQAQELFNSFREHWSDDCACSTGHPCGITTQKFQEGGERHARIMLMFNPLSGDQGSQLRLRVDEECPQGGKEACSLVLSDGAVADEEDGLDALSQRLFASNMQRKLKPRRKLSAKSFWRWLSRRDQDQKLENGNGKQTVSGSLTDIELSSSVSPQKPIAAASSSQQNSQAQDMSSKVRFNLVRGELSGEVNDNSIPIQNLCAAIDGRPVKSCLGFLESKNNQRIYLHSAPWERPPRTCEVETLDSALHTQVYRAKRLRIGLSTVLLVACVGASPWLSISWSPVDLSLVRDPDSSALQPYFVHESLLKTLKQSKAIAVQAPGRSNLFVLGIILLELLFGQKLESHPIYPSMLEGSTSKEITDFCTALKWQEDVEPAFGKPLANAIAWCLSCFRNPAKGIESPDCLEEMWQHVVLPLERFLSTW